MDYHSEKLVQAALDKACKGRTTLVVSHRLSAIRHAHRIVYIENGKAVEQGTHEELMKLEGFYHKMVTVHSYDDSAEELLNELEEVAEIKERKMSYEVEPYQLGTRNSIVSLEKNAEFQMKNLNGLANITMNQEIDDPRVPSANFISTFFRILGWARPSGVFSSLAPYVLDFMESPCRCFP